MAQTAPDAWVFYLHQLGNDGRNAWEWTLADGGGILHLAREVVVAHPLPMTRSPNLEPTLMRIVDHKSQPLEEWRFGVMTRMRVSAMNGAGQLCLFEQFCEPSKGAPIHLHAVEEVLTVPEGKAEIWVDDERATLAAGQSMIVPAEHRHGFQNVGETILHVLAILASPIFEASFDDQTETRRRWSPE